MTESNIVQNSTNSAEKPPKRAYHRKQPQQIQSNLPNPHIDKLESDLAPLVNQRLEANRKVLAATQRANQANFDLGNAQNELVQIEAEVNYRMNLISQLRNGGMPVPNTPYVAQSLTPPESLAGYPLNSAPYRPGASALPPSAPYSPVVPFPNPADLAPAPGVGSLPAPNYGLYPDRTPRGPMLTDPESIVNTENEYQFPPEVLAKINAGRS